MKPSAASGQLNFEWDICAEKHGGNPESVEAHARTDAAGGRARVAEFIRRSGRDWTAYEIERALRMRRSTASARFSELKYMRLLVRSGKRRKTDTGCNAAAMRHRVDSDPPVRPYDSGAAAKERAADRLDQETDA